MVWDRRYRLPDYLEMYFRDVMAVSRNGKVDLSVSLFNEDQGGWTGKQFWSIQENRAFNYEEERQTNIVSSID